MYRKVSFSLAAVLLLTGCAALDSAKSGFDHSKAVSASLERSLGLKSHVGFNWANGSLKSVTVNFQELPDKESLKEIALASKAAILSEFKQTPQTIVVSFFIDPN